MLLLPHVLDTPLVGFCMCYEWCVRNVDMTRLNSISSICQRAAAAAAAAACCRPSNTPAEMLSTTSSVITTFSNDYVMTKEPARL